MIELRDKVDLISKRGPYDWPVILLGDCTSRTKPTTISIILLTHSHCGCADTWRIGVNFGWLKCLAVSQLPKHRYPFGGIPVLSGHRRNPFCVAPLRNVRRKGVPVRHVFAGIL